MTKDDRILSAKPVTGWRCIICGENADISSSGNTWCWSHYEQSYEYLGPDKGKTWMELRRELVRAAHQTLKKISRDLKLKDD